MNGNEMAHNEIARSSSYNDPAYGFNDDDVEKFIVEFSQCDDALMWLEDHAPQEKEYPIGAEMMRNLSIAWIKDKAAVHAVAGSEFWYLMKDMALAAYVYENQIDNREF